MWSYALFTEGGKILALHQGMGKIHCHPTVLYFLAIMIKSGFSFASFVILRIQSKLLEALQIHGNLLLFADKFNRSILHHQFRWNMAQTQATF